MISININFISVLFVLLFLITTVYWITRPTFKFKYWKLFILRSILAILLLTLLFQLRYNIGNVKTKPQLKLLVDTSYSMKFNNRINKVKEFLKKYLDALTKEMDTSIYIFDEKLHKVDSIHQITISAKGTKINSVIEEILYMSKDNTNQTILLFSDGKNATLDLPVIEKENVSIIPIIFEEDNFKDVSISNLKYSSLGFKDVNYEVVVKLLCFGYENRNCKIFLTDVNSKTTVCEKEIVLKEGENEVKLNFIPKEIGKVKYKLAVQHFPQEITYENNEVNINVEIKKNKIRILYLCGQPSPEYYFLRNLIKNDPNLDLVSFVILRNPESVVIVPEDDLALIPFPTYDIFVKELFNYDLVIFENFSYRKFAIPVGYLENIRQFVLSGGGFIMIGGDKSFSLGGYKFTPIEEILPVKLVEIEKFVTMEYRPEIVNFNDKMLKVVDDAELNKLIWKTIPPLNNYQTVERQQNSTVLMTYRNVPIMSYWVKGKGRVFACGTNSTYRWVLGNILSTEYDYKKAYVQFWKNVIYWCSGAEDIKSLYIVTDSDEYLINEVVKFKLYYNIADTEITQLPEVYIIQPDMSKKKLELKKISLGTYTGEFVGSMIGEYSIVAVVNKYKDTLKDIKKIVVKQININNLQEIADLKLDKEYLTKIAKLTNNEPVLSTKFNIQKFISDVKNRHKKYFVNFVEVYQKPFLGILFIGLFLIEIFLGKFMK